MTVSAADNLRNQRKFTITGLIPATEYQLQVEGHNAAGSTLADYYFFTLTEDGGELLTRSFRRIVCRFYLLYSTVFVRSFCRRASTGTGREESNISSVLLHGHENGYSSVRHVRRRSGGRLHSVRLLEKKYGYYFHLYFFTMSVDVTTR